MKENENRQKCLQLITPVIRKMGVSQLKIADIARYMDISRATLYNYFSSKDEIVNLVIDQFVQYFNEADHIVLNKESSYAKRFLVTYESSLAAAMYISDILLADLKKFYPNLNEIIFTIYYKRAESLKLFFNSGMDEGVFYRINPTLYMVQDEVVLRRIMDPSFSIQYDMTLKQALMDFYYLKKHQLFKPNHLDTIDDSEMEKHVSYFVQKVSQQV